MTDHPNDLIFHSDPALNFHSEHFSDEDGNPLGGSASGRGFAIAWQHGPLGRGVNRKVPNGAFVETVLGSIRDRLLFYQNGPFACVENEQAIEHIEAALAVMAARTADREKRGVEGVNEQ